MSDLSPACFSQSSDLLCQSRDQETRLWMIFSCESNDLLIKWKPTDSIEDSTVMRSLLDPAAKTASSQAAISDTNTLAAPASTSTSTPTSMPTPTPMPAPGTKTTQKPQANNHQHQHSCWSLSQKTNRFLEFNRRQSVLWSIWRRAGR